MPSERIEKVSGFIPTMLFRNHPIDFDPVATVTGNMSYAQYKVLRQRDQRR